MTKKTRRIDRIFLSSFMCLLASLVVIHLTIFWRDFDLSTRNLSYLSIGLGYDILVVAEFCLTAYLFNFIHRGLYKIVLAFLGLCLLIFSFGDYLYYLNFSTHVPFSNVEYTGEFSTFLPSFWNALSSSYMLILVLTCAFFLSLVFKSKSDDRLALKTKIYHFVGLALIAAMSGAYSNGVVYKDIHSPIVSNSVWYALFTYTNNEKTDKQIPFPKESFDFVEKLSKFRLKEPEKKFISFKSAKNCDQKNSKMKESLCQNRPNILLILMESYRGDDVGALGSELGITPEFDKLAREGILFKNFYANGFQTRHGLVASYCSLFPNYGSPVLKSYYKNDFYCLPKLLKDHGYSNLWAHGSDASFDNQLKFIPKIGFENFFDIHDFPITTEKLGWGVSDQKLFQRWLAELNTLPQPFFSSALTITNHHPFSVPKEFKKFSQSDQRFKFYNAMHYSDHALGKFIREAKKQDWYKNTLIFITADTSSHIASHKKIRNIKQRVKLHARVPLLIVGGPLKEAMTVEAYHSQVDIAPTIADILNIEEELPFVGSSLLDENEDSLAYTNWPGNYWSAMTQSASYYRSADKKDHFYGDSKKRDFLKKLSSSLIKISKWSYQNNSHSKM